MRTTTFLLLWMVTTAVMTYVGARHFPRRNTVHIGLFACLLSFGLIYGLIFAVATAVHRL